MDKFYLLLLYFLLNFALLIVFSVSFHGSFQEYNDEIVEPSRIIQLSWQPRASLYKGFLSREECDHLISLAKGKLLRAMVDINGENFVDSARTNSGYFINKDHDWIVSRIESRIAAWTFLPKENGEPMQILRYKNGEKYDPHSDVLPNEAHIISGGNRYATVILYLSDVAIGGETVFPASEDSFSHHGDKTFSDCAKQGIAVKPKKGDALLFFSLHPNTSIDEYNVHASCPIIKGEKWSATKWIRLIDWDLSLRNYIAQRVPNSYSMDDQ